MKLITVLIFSLLFSPFLISAQSIMGKWKTIDDETGKARSVVEIYEKNGKVYGKIVKLYRDSDEDQNPICKACPDDRHNQKILGMEIIRGLSRDGNEYEDGTIIDPKSGKIYDCKLWTEDGKLMVRGYIAFLFRTQTWLPYRD